MNTNHTRATLHPPNGQRRRRLQHLGGPCLAIGAQPPLLAVLALWWLQHSQDCSGEETSETIAIFVGFFFSPPSLGHFSASETVRRNLRVLARLPISPTIITIVARNNNALDSYSLSRLVRRYCKRVEGNWWHLFVLQNKDCLFSTCWLFGHWRRATPLFSQRYSLN
jgi:hypothetical protein